MSLEGLGEETKQLGMGVVEPGPQANGLQEFKNSAMLQQLKCSEAQFFCAKLLDCSLAYRNRANSLPGPLHALTTAVCIFFLSVLRPLCNVRIMSETNALLFICNFFSMLLKGNSCVKTCDARPLHV